MHNWRDIVCKRLADSGLDPIADSGLIEELAQHMEDRFVESRAAGATEVDNAAPARERIRPPIPASGRCGLLEERRSAAALRE